METPNNNVPKDVTFSWRAPETPAVPAAIEAAVEQQQADADNLTGAATVTPVGSTTTPTPAAEAQATPVAENQITSAETAAPAAPEQH